VADQGGFAGAEEAGDLPHCHTSCARSWVLRPDSKGRWQHRAGAPRPSRQHCLDGRYPGLWVISWRRLPRWLPVWVTCPVALSAIGYPHTVAGAAAVSAGLVPSSAFPFNPPAGGTVETRCLYAAGTG
jgi:hypothetical protein